MEGCWKGRGQKLEDKLGLSQEGLTTTRLLFFFPWQTHPGTWPSLSPFTHQPGWDVGSSLPETSGFRKGGMERRELSPGRGRVLRLGHLSPSPAGLWHPQPPGGPWR